MTIVNTTRWTEDQKLMFIELLWMNTDYAVAVKPQCPEFEIAEARRLLTQGYLHYLCGKPMKIVVSRDIWLLVDYETCCPIDALPSRIIIEEFDKLMN